VKLLRRDRGSTDNLNSSSVLHFRNWVSLDAGKGMKCDKIKERGYGILGICLRRDLEYMQWSMLRGFQASHVSVSRE
jgi:hypothetical protein